MSATRRSVGSRAVQRPRGLAGALEAGLDGGAAGAGRVYSFSRGLHLLDVPPGPVADAGEWLVEEVRPSDVSE